MAARGRGAFSPQRLKTQKGKDALVQELKGLHDTLVDYAPEDPDAARPKWMGETCPVLVSKRVLNHQHKDVRLMACCCVVEMLRVYAPEAPFSDKQLKDAFEAIIIELRGLQHPERAAFDRVVSILESLAVVKSCVIVVTMAEDGHEELVTSLFQVLLQSARPEHTARTRSLMADVMKTCVEEFEGPVPDTLTEIVVEAVLHYRAPSEDDEDDEDGEDGEDGGHGDSAQRATGVLAAEVCIAPELEKPLQLFLNRLALNYGLLHNRGADEDDHDLQDMSPLQDRMFKVASKLSSLSESLLLKALPTICANLTNPDKDVRGPVISFVGELFAAEGSKLPLLFSTSFRQWLDRFQDSDTGIRSTMVDAGMAILYGHTDAAVVGPVAKAYRARLRDPDKDVRRRAVQCTCEMAANACANISTEILRDVGERCHDRVSSVRLDAVTGLSQVFKHIVSSKWNRVRSDDSSDDDEDGDEDEDGAAGAAGAWITVPPEQQEHLGWIPGHIIQAFNIPDVDTQARVLQLVDEILLPKSLSAHNRAAGLVYMFAHFGTGAHTQFARMQMKRRSIQHALQRFAEDPHDDQAAVPLREFLVHFKGVEAAHFEGLRSVKDQRVFAQLKALAQADATAADLRSSRIDVLKRLGSKSPVAAMVKQLLRFALMATVDIDGIEHVCELALSSSRAPTAAAVGGGRGAGKKTGKKKAPKSRAGGAVKQDSVVAVSTHEAAMDLLVLLVDNFPTAVSGCTESIVSHLLAQGHGVSHAAKVAKCFALVIPAAAAGDHIISAKKLLAAATKRFLPAVLDRPPQWAKAVVEGMCAYLKRLSTTSKKHAATRRAFLSDAVQLLAPPRVLSLANARIDSVLQALGAIANDSPSLLDDDMDRLVEFVFSNCLTATPPPGSATGGKKKTSIAWRSVATAATKFLVRVVVGAHSASTSAGETDDIEDDILAERKQRAADIAAKLFSTVQIVSNTVDSRTPELCTDNREHLLLCAARSLLKIAGSVPLEPAQWHALAWTLRDSSAYVRATMLAKFRPTFMKYAARTEFVCALALTAEEPRNSKAMQSATSQLKSLIKRARMSYQATRAEMDADGGESSVQLELVQVESCVAHFVHLLAHHPALSTPAAVEATAQAAADAAGEDGAAAAAAPAVALKDLVKAGADSPLTVWDSGVGRQGLLKGMAAQMDFLLKSLFEGQPNLQNAELINAILRTIHDAEDAMDPDNRNIHVVSEMMQGRVRRIMEKVATAPKPHPGTIRLDASCYAPPRRAGRRESAMSAIPADLSMSSMPQSPEHSSMDHSMGSFLNHGRDTLLPDDFDAASRRSTLAAAKPKRKSPQSASKDAKATRKVTKTKPKQIASPVRRSTRASRASRPNYAEGEEEGRGKEEDEDENEDEDEEDEDEEDEEEEDEEDEEQEEADQENDERQARRQNVAKTTTARKRKPAVGGAAKSAAKPGAKLAAAQSFRSSRRRRR